MTTGTPLPAFQHDPLPEQTSHFRLLQVIHSDFGQHVECKISAWPIHNAPPYYAISYTWGDPADTTEITINGRPLVVRRNCEYVLQQAFVSKASQYFWVDAICIAQTTEERNHQVGIMGKIYSRAKHVLACVGHQENDSEFLSEILTKRHSLLRKIRKTPQGNNWRQNPIQEHELLLFRCLLSINPKTRQRLYQSFYAFMGRSYFKRLWIIQELNLAQRVSYCFGAAVVAAEEFLALYQLLDIWIDNPHDHRPLLLPSARAKLLMSFTRNKLARSRTKTSQAMLSTFIGISTQSSLLHLACTTEKRDIVDILMDPNVQCSDPRDRLFGVLSIAGWRQPVFIPPKPDYTKDRFEVALDTCKLIYQSHSLKFHIHCAKALCQLFQVTGEEASLRHATSLRSGSSRTEAISYYPESFPAKGRWYGFRISDDAEELGVSEPIYGGGMRICVSAKEDKVCRNLRFKKGLKTLSISAPLCTRSGDWWLLLDHTRTRMHVGLVVRKFTRGSYSPIGCTLHADSHHQISSMVYLTNAFSVLEGFWYPEDLLLLGWIWNKLESDDITQDEINEYINMPICARDGSSFFEGILGDIE